jgi:hypothetical protein
MRQNVSLLTQHVSGTSMPIISSTIVSSTLESRLGCVACRVTSSEQHIHLRAQRYTTQTAFQVWTPESGNHYCTPDDGHNSARNMLSQ